MDDDAKSFLARESARFWAVLCDDEKASSALPERLDGVYLYAPSTVPSVAQWKVGVKIGGTLTTVPLERPQITALAKMFAAALDETPSAE